MRRFTTITDVIRDAIAPALGEYADEYDLEAIAHEAYEYRVDTDKFGRGLANTAGFESVVDADEFWEIVQKHHK